MDESNLLLREQPRRSGTESAQQVLVVDDDPACRRILQKFLEKDGYRVVLAANGQDALAQARALKPDLILCDWMMPGMDGLQVCQAVKEDPALKDTFFIFLTALDKKHIDTGISQGADDFITKPIDPVEVSAKVKAGLRLSRAQKVLLHQAHRDGLTGLYNRRGWEEKLAQACLDRRSFYVVLVDVDRLKEINDRFGHQEGDAFLQGLARLWAEKMREGEALARLGGDEFACLLFRPLTQGRSLRQRLEADLKEVFPQLPVGLSLGYASFQPRRPETPGDLMAQADARLYQDKRRRARARH
jgi:diguanylate cyclase (GGDEF)-like protein